MSITTRVIGNATLYLGDCMLALPAPHEVDAIITDPPYGIDLKNHGMRDGRRRTTDFQILGDESQELGIEVNDWAKSHNLPTAFFASPRKPWPGEWRSYLVWDKGGAVGGGGDIRTCWKQTWELIQIARNGPLNGGRDEAVIRWPVTPKDSKLHSCQKPVGLMEYLIFKLNAKKVFDPFMGSGSTGVAAVKMGRMFIGIEREPRYFEIACRRIEEAQKQVDMFQAANDAKAAPVDASNDSSAGLFAPAELAGTT